MTITPTDREHMRAYLNHNGINHISITLIDALIHLFRNLERSDHA